MRYAYIVDEQIAEFRDYPEGTEVDLAVLRPVTTVPYTVQSWQVVSGVHYDIFADHVDEVFDIVDRALADVKRDSYLALEVEFDAQKAKGFAYNGDAFPLNANGDKAHDLIRRGKGPASPQVLNTKGQLVPLASNEKNAWLTAGDDRFLVLFQVHDNHVAGITATTTPEEAATYNVAADWPPLPTDEPEGEP